MPIPLPGGLVVKNGSPARLTTSALIPAPWSLTSKIICPFQAEIHSRTHFPFGEASSALSTKIPTACSTALSGSDISGRFAEC